VEFYDARGPGACDIAGGARSCRRICGRRAGPAVAQPTAVMALVAKGMNDVINAQGTRKPRGGTGFQAAWLLLMIIAICSNL
jgi:hypothetical protein